MDFPWIFLAINFINLPWTEFIGDLIDFSLLAIAAYDYWMVNQYTVPVICHSQGKWQHAIGTLL